MDETCRRLASTAAARGEGPLAASEHVHLRHRSAQGRRIIVLAARDAGVGHAQQRLAGGHLGTCAVSARRRLRAQQRWSVRTGLADSLQRDRTRSPRCRRAQRKRCDRFLGIMAHALRDAQSPASRDAPAECLQPARLRSNIHRPRCSRSRGCYSASSGPEAGADFRKCAELHAGLPSTMCWAGCSS